jgi:hypothetical protein
MVSALECGWAPVLRLQPLAVLGCSGNTWACGRAMSAAVFMELAVARCNAPLRRPAWACDRCSGQWPGPPCTALPWSPLQARHKIQQQEPQQQQHRRQQRHHRRQQQRQQQQQRQLTVPPKWDRAEQVATRCCCAWVVAPVHSTHTCSLSTRHAARRRSWLREATAGMSHHGGPAAMPVLWPLCCMPTSNAVLPATPVTVQLWRPQRPPVAHPRGGMVPSARATALVEWSCWTPNSQSRNREKMLLHSPHNTVQRAGRLGGRGGTQAGAPNTTRAHGRSSAARGHRQRMPAAAARPLVQGPLPTSATPLALFV